QKKLPGKKIDPVTISAGLHISLAGLIMLGMAFTKYRTEKIDIEVKVIEQPTLAPQADIDLTQAPVEPPPPKPVARKVFGATRDSLKTSDPAAGEDIKAG